MCCVVLVVEFESDEFVGSESSGNVEVVVIISGGSSITPIEVEVNPKQIQNSGKGYNVMYELVIFVLIVNVGPHRDFDTSRIAVMFAAGDVTKRVNIPVSCDVLVEGEERIDIRLSLMNANPQIKMGRSRSTGRIIDSTGQ